MVVLSKDRGILLHLSMNYTILKANTKQFQSESKTNRGCNMYFDAFNVASTDNLTDEDAIISELNKEYMGTQTVVDDTSTSLLPDEFEDQEFTEPQDYLLRELQEPIKKKHQNEMVGPYFKTSYVAKRLGISEQKVRTMSRDFEDFITFNQVSNYRVYNEESIQQFENILNIQYNKNYTVQQTLWYLKNTDGGEIMSAGSDTQKFEKMFELLAKSVNETVEKTVQEGFKQYGQALETTLRQDRLEQKKDVQQLDEITEELSQLKELIRSQQEAIAQKDQTIDKILKEQSEQSALLLQKLEKKKFSFFKKS